VRESHKPEISSKIGRVLNLRGKTTRAEFFPEYAPQVFGKRILKFRRVVIISQKGGIKIGTDERLSCIR